MTESSDAIIQGSKRQREDSISHAGGVNRAKLRVSDSLAEHKRAYGLARAAHIAYGKIFGRGHMLPNAYIIGFAKCGTTSLYSYLTEHPQIHASFTKEVHYHDHNERYARGQNWYRSNFPTILQKSLYERATRKKFVSIDATPRYINHPHTLSRIKSIECDARFIAVVRNPIDRAYSHYNMNASGASWMDEDLSFADAIAAEESRIDGEYERMERDESYYSTKYFGYAYASRGLYAKWLARWMDEFGDRVLVLDSDSLRADAQATLDRVTDFLGVNRHTYADTRQRNVGNYEQEIDAETRKRLAAYYEKPNRELYALIGRDLGWG